MLLLIAHGNPMRRDEGAGHVLADRLEKTWRERGIAVRRLDVLQLTPELALDVADPAVGWVVFVDAQPGRPDRGPALIMQMVRAAPAPFAEHLTPAGLLAYAAQYTATLPQTWSITVPGVDFDFGADLSENVRRGLNGIQGLLKTMLADWPPTAGDASSPPAHPPAATSALTGAFS